jgi:hypothetical protein
MVELPVKKTASAEGGFSLKRFSIATISFSYFSTLLESASWNEGTSNRQKENRRSVSMVKAFKRV